MKHFRPDFFLKTAGLLAMLDTVNNTPTKWRAGFLASFLSDDGVIQLADQFATVEKECRDYGLRMSANTAHQIVSVLSKQNGFSHSELFRLVDHLQSRLEEEIGYFVFYALGSEKEHFVNDPFLFGEDVALHFPNAVSDVEEAGKCLGFG